MLVLTRKRSERIRIGDTVTITIVKIGPDAVRLGIDAPREMRIVREELLACESKQTTDGTEHTDRDRVLLAQHEGPLEADGGPCGVPVLAGTTREEWPHERGVAPDLNVIGIRPNKPK